MDCYFPDSKMHFIILPVLQHYQTCEAGLKLCRVHMLMQKAIIFMSGIAATTPHLPPSLGSTVVGMATAGLAALAEFAGMTSVVLGLGGLLLANKVYTSEGRRPGFSGLPLL